MRHDLKVLCNPRSYKYAVIFSILLISPELFTPRLASPDNHTLVYLTHDGQHPCSRLCAVRARSLGFCTGKGLGQSSLQFPLSVPSAGTTSQGSIEVSVAVSLTALALL